MYPLKIDDNLKTKMKTKITFQVNFENTPIM